MVAVTTQPVDWAMAATLAAGLGVHLWGQHRRWRCTQAQHRRAMRALGRATRHTQHVR